MNINKEWHLAHKMPKNPTLEQRIQWHTEHQKYCQCWPVPSNIEHVIHQRTIDNVQGGEITHDKKRINSRIG